MPSKGILLFEVVVVSGDKVNEKDGERMMNYYYFLIDSSGRTSLELFPTPSLANSSLANPSLIGVIGNICSYYFSFARHILEWEKEKKPVIKRAIVRTKLEEAAGG